MNCANAILCGSGRHWPPTRPVKPGAKPTFGDILRKLRDKKRKA